MHLDMMYTTGTTTCIWFW